MNNLYQDINGSVIYCCPCCHEPLAVIVIPCHGQYADLKPMSYCPFCGKPIESDLYIYDLNHD